MSSEQATDGEKFLRRLRRSGLLSAEQLQQATQLAAQTDKARLLARTLVEKGLLTRFQAELVLAGRTDGFVLGQYRILDQIGRGGMGRVFKAEHMTMNRVVALKVLSNRLTRTDRSRQMFQREVRAAARLVHPNIVTAYDANETDGRLFLVMEFVDGSNLQELVQELGPLPVGHVCEFIRQAALGLQYAFELGMVHRDIKPANLLVHRAGPLGGCVVKILDFGLARLNEPKQEQYSGHDSIPAAEQSVMGTPDFLSPEQARNLHNVDIRSDLYSLGCTFFYLLTGQVPFPGGTALEKLVRHGAEDPVPVSKLRAEVPAEVSAIVTRLMCKKPEERFQTPLELANAVAPFSVQGPAMLQTPPSSKGELELPGAAVSPWAELMDSDESSALAGTLPPGIGITPLGSGTGSTLIPGRVTPRAHRPWLLPAVLVGGAVILGLAVGVTALLLLR